MNDSIDVDVPVRMAYDQWTQFEDFPLFMDHVDEVRQVTENLVRWKASIAGVSREWEAEITTQRPDELIEWHSVDGSMTRGSVSFRPIDEGHTHIVLDLDFDPQGILEHIADKGGFVSDRAHKDLVSFKEFIEDRGRATGAYRGEIEGDRPGTEHTDTEEPAGRR